MRRQNPLQPMRGWRAGVLVFALIAAPICAAVLVLTWEDRNTLMALDERGVVTDGAVLKAERREGSWYAIVRFTARDGKTRTREIATERWGPRWTNSKPRKGDVVAVRYDPADPGHRVADASMPLDTRKYTIAMIVSGSLCVAIAIAGALSLRGHLRTRERDELPPGSAITARPTTRHRPHG